MLSYTPCTLCAHRCGVRRTEGARGRCGSTDEVLVARAALHAWEEPPISGTRGAGAVFFSGCSLGCIYCQNRPISHEGRGRAVSAERLCEIYLALQAEGAHTLDLVTPTHVAPTVYASLCLAKARGLSIPVVYNTSSFDTPETVRAMAEVVDVFLPDLKYMRPATARAYSGTDGYPEAARAAIDEMVRLRPRVVLDADGIVREGVIVRVLLLPGHVAEAKLAVSHLLRAYGDGIYISLMSQYTPRDGLPSPLCRRVSRAEYDDLLTFACKIGLKNAFTQEFESADERFIPLFDFTGL